MRRSHIHPSPQALLGLAEAADEALGFAPGEGAALLSVVDEGLEAALAMRPVPDRMHPLDLLEGFDAPPDWVAVGVATTGTGTPQDGGGRFPLRAVFLTSAEGAWASALIPLGDAAGPRHLTCGEFDDDGAPQGLIPDALRRVLGADTPVEFDTLPEELLDALWLDRVVEVLADGRPPAWPFLEHAHPARSYAAAATDLHEAIDDLVFEDWEGLRLLCAAGRLEVPGLRPDVAAWLDEGSFARRAFRDLPDLWILRQAVAAMVPHDVWELVATHLRAA